LHLHIFHTNDVHSELDRFARLAARLRSLRAQLARAGHTVLTFDIGDHIDSVNPLTRATNGLVNARALRALDYDGWVFGNNETLTLDRRAWPDLLETAAMPLYCGNVDLLLPPHIARRFDRGRGSIEVFNGVRVGVCGVTVYFARHFPALGIAASDPVPLAFEQVNRLRAQGADVVILLSHLGLRTDQQMAEAGLDADIILGAHTHQFVDEPQQVGRAYIMQAGKYAMALGHVDVTIEGGRVTQVRGRLLPTQDSDPADAAVLDVVRSCREPAQRWLAHPVASVEQPLRHSVCGESAVVNLIADRIRRDSGADVALVNGGVVAGSLRAGTVRMRDLLAVCGTPMRSIRMHLTGEQLADVIRQGLQPGLMCRQGFGFGFRAHSIGRLHVSGARVRTLRGLDPQGSTTETLVGLDVGDAPVAADRRYQVTLCEFVGLSPVFSGLSGLAYEYNEERLQDALAAALTDADAVAQARMRRYIPASL